MLAVPNAPCGVESGYEDRFVWEFVAFLMHRVELKEEKIDYVIDFVPSS